MTLSILRKEKKLTQCQLASKLDVKQSAVSMWENGRSEPGIETITQLSIILGCSREAILNCFDNKKSPTRVEQRRYL